MVLHFDERFASGCFLRRDYIPTALQDAPRMKEKREHGSPSQLRVNRAPKRGLLAAEVGDKPEEERERGAEEKAGDDGEVERGVFAAVNDVAGQSAQAEGELVPEIKKTS